jgi:TIR domain-containing protein
LPSAERDSGDGRVSGTGAIRIFVTYSHQDAQYLDKSSLLGFLSGLESEGFEFWADREIATGEDWADRIRTEMNRSDIALALVSQAFLNSPYCQDVEISRFIELRKQNGLIVYPVILYPCDWQSYDWLRTTQYQPPGGTVEGNFRGKARRQTLFLEILEELRDLGAKIRSRPGRG